ncbi:MAG TPA: cytochrome P450 [Steroidobacteraceae bacterium]|nr:cytochrome P450 [Steroidobacteraceae bacterium]
MEPGDPIEAVTHRDPYPYYARLLEEGALRFDERLRSWVAAGAGAVSEALTSAACRARPPAEPVPPALEGLPAGEIFALLVRMADGRRHDAPKLALERALASVPGNESTAMAREAARRALPIGLDPHALTAWMLDTPAAVIAELLGLSPEERRAILDWTGEFVACLSPLSTPRQLSAAHAAASRLRSRVRSVLDAITPQSSGLVARVRNHARSVGWDDDVSITANLVGLLSQSYEATAGLIGNSIVALASRPGLLGEVRARVDGWQQLVHETSRHDSPVQNTRRFVAQSTAIAGVELAPGAAVLLVLAAANRDPRANPDPHAFRLERPERCVFSFSQGGHACPGQALARHIAAAALAVLFETVPAGALARLDWTWRPSTNCRVPTFGLRAPQGEGGEHGEV